VLDHVPVVAPLASSIAMTEPPACWRCLEFRSGNSHRPVLDTLDLVHRYRSATDLTYYPAGETVPVHAGRAVRRLG
jgi:hypothetical protein